MAERRWTLVDCKVAPGRVQHLRCGLGCGCPPVEVVPAVVAERLAEAAERYLNAWSVEDTAAAQAGLSVALAEFRSSPADSQEQGGEDG